MSGRTQRYLKDTAFQGALTPRRPLISQGEAPPTSGFRLFQRRGNAAGLRKLPSLTRKGSEQLRILLWSHSGESETLISPILSSAGHVLFRASSSDSLLSDARREQPFLIVLAVRDRDPQLLTAVESLASHPDTRWTPILLLAQGDSDRGHLRALLEAGASALITLDQDTDLLHARLTALERSVLQVANLRSARFTDEQTGFYHKTFLEDQLKVYCRKQLRDGVAFCLMFLELRGTDENVHKAALHLAATVRGADLFGRWDNDLFAVLLPASGEEQARLLARRFEAILGKEPLQARAGLIVSSRCTVEPEALVESATNTLDSAWQSDSPFLWTWSESDGAGVPATKEPTAG